MENDHSIQANLILLKQKITESALRSGRTEKDVQLVAVSKTFPVPMIREAFEAGQWRFGENRIQDALQKIPLLPESLEWHFVGHLQKNKARQCPGNFQWIHSIDSTELVKTLEKRCELEKKNINALIQVNLSKETTKSGLLEWDDLCTVAEEILGCRWLKLKGLMTIADPQDSEKDTRKTFAMLAHWRERLVQKFGNQEECTELSMGMSADYLWAIEEGATLIRIGSAIFGKRG
ncbi:MAG: YggS family pyridoxal phosphate-dependent enzyme [SAR324 cluster bacterium]|nr:YggS family pyridoxal phosphate-dependent enzyme [SAR324 cluster bacterium]